ncbi:vault protein inter-alpha-trypsin [Variibacter gotjawalensis]|uniref:Vault protein inter-alpha-trypsin n=1 Tax=Variibacter gotjawalensis TaxID=1333996 RepID=A0A0S3Q0F5_9BRAD|nr:marine proteobacterial sortase target protein [Variibacter gotjawalensis]NIK47504.1 Ca-activated chloride channel family protein [Variibacter gotjawalensis]RZS49400.1 Ca-activated chloride channel family protein [Variibacter gotjawalensis]BAT61663.1 vault protein inter-alpha-trypsin [Variibacter gotjawalensis]
MHTYSLPTQHRAPTIAEWLAISAPAILFFVVMVLAALFALPARAAQAPIFVKPGEVRAGSLLLKTNQEGRYVGAPRVATDVDVTVSGPTARTRITQIFHNPTDGWVEAVYVYPLPEGSAVDTLKMVVGDRVVVGSIKERQAAKVIYEKAKEAGQKASLVEQERPNIFTNSVANIGPGETIVVQIEYQEPIRHIGNEYSLRIPLVVGPRYNGKPIAQTVDFTPGSGWGNSTNVPDRERIEPPVLDPRKQGKINPVQITVRVAAGFPLGELKSHHHAVKTEADGDARIVKLAEGPVPADRDFELTWKPAAQQAPSVGLFRERVAGSDYVLAYVTPPTGAATEDNRPREVILVVDNSGSMGGTSMVQAKASLIYALGRLKPTDRFNIVRFDDTLTVLFQDTVPADAEHIGQAKRYVDSLQAKGGTEMVPAMKAALTDPRGSDGKFLRQVVFLTDGAIGNEQQLFETITALRGRSRVFMVGIGSAPNSYLMTRASELGRGTFTHIGSTDQVETRMRSLFEKLESPAVTNLVAKFTVNGADVTPESLPDLYRGEPLVVAARVGSLSGELVITGTIGDQPWSVTLPLAGAAEGKGLSKVWARRKIDDTEVSRTTRTATPEAADAAILKLALEHSLVTRLTSLVAIDETPSRPAGTRLTRTEVPLNLPEGWDFDLVFGDSGNANENRPAVTPDGEPEQRRADQQKVRAQYAQLPIQKAAAPQAAQATPTTVRLPQTATDAELRLWFGLLLCLISLLLMGFGRGVVRLSR